MADDTLTLHLDGKTLASLDAVAAETNRDREEIVSDVLKAYLDRYKEEVAHVMEGVRQADAGRFVAQEEVEAFFERIKTNS